MLTRCVEEELHVCPKTPLDPTILAVLLPQQQFPVNEAIDGGTGARETETDSDRGR
jgi:hypothetical protein